MSGSAFLQELPFIYPILPDFIKNYCLSRIIFPDAQTYMYMYNKIDSKASFHEKKTTVHLLNTRNIGRNIKSVLLATIRMSKQL